MRYLDKAHLELNHHEQAKELLVDALNEFQRSGLSQKKQEAKSLLGLKD